MVGGLQHAILGDPLSAPAIHLLQRGPCSLDRSIVVVLLLVVSSCQMAGISSADFGCDGQAFSRDAPASVSVFASAGLPLAALQFFQGPLFCSMFQRLTPRMSFKHLIWKVFNFWVSCSVTAQVLAPYKRTDIPSVRNTLIW